MNRSILIVICDFIVSSMLTMIAGLSQNPVLAGGSNGVPLDNRTATVVLTELRREQEQLTAAHRRMLEEQLKSGNPAEKKAELEAMTRKLAEAGARIELLEKQLALTPDTAGPLRAEQLQSQLEHELNQRHLLRLQQQETEAMLEELRRQNRLTGEKYQDLREQFAARRKISGSARTVCRPADRIADRPAAHRRGGDRIDHHARHAGGTQCRTWLAPPGNRRDGTT